MKSRSGEKSNITLIKSIVGVSLLFFVVSGFLAVHKSKQGISDYFENTIIAEAKHLGSHADDILCEIKEAAQTYCNQSAEQKDTQWLIGETESIQNISGAFVLEWEANDISLAVQGKGYIPQEQIASYIESSTGLLADEIYGLADGEEGFAFAPLNIEGGRRLIIAYTFQTSENSIKSIIAKTEDLVSGGGMLGYDAFGTSFFIVDSHGNAYPLSKEVPNITYGELESNRRTAKKYITAEYISSADDIRYIAVVKKSALLPADNEISVWIYSTCCLVLFLALIYFVNKNFGKKKQCRNEAEEELECEIPLSLSGSEKFLNRPTYPSKPKQITKLWYLEKIILGLIRYDQLEEYYKFDLHFKNALVFVLNFGTPKSSVGCTNDVSFSKMDKICEEIFNEKTSIFFMDVEYKSVGVIMNEDSSEVFESEIGEILEVLSKRASKELDVDIGFCMSDICHSFDEISKAYVDASYTFTYYYLHSNLQRFSYYSDIKNQKCDYLDVPRMADVEKRYIGLIGNHKFVKAKSELLSVIETMDSLVGLYNRVLQTAIFDIVDMTLKGLSILNQNDVERIFNKFELIDQMLQIDNLGHLKEKCAFVLDSLIRDFDTKDMNIEEKIHAVEAYVNANYSDSDLNVNKLADIFSISVQYLSKSFKQYRGISTQSYIVSVRIKNAKKLLIQNESLSVASIAKEVGFGSSQTFIRTFKREEGTTPGKIR